MSLEPPSLIAISGPVCAGKSTLADGLARTRGAVVLTTRSLIAHHLGRPAEVLSRSELQEAGDELDRKRGGSWVAAGVKELRDGAAALVVVDAVRNARQLEALAAEIECLHVHLNAEDATLAARYAERIRANPQLEFRGFAQLRANRTEAQVKELAGLAGLAIDTSCFDPAETLARVLLRLDQGEAEEESPV